MGFLCSLSVAGLLVVANRVCLSILLLVSPVSFTVAGLSFEIFSLPSGSVLLVELSAVSLASSVWLLGVGFIGPVLVLSFPLIVSDFPVVLLIAASAASASRASSASSSTSSSSSPSASLGVVLCWV